MIERQKEKYGWEFLFLGANIDAGAEAERFGIDRSRSVNYQADSDGTALNYSVLSETILNIRTTDSQLGSDWKERIEYGNKRRRKGEKHNVRSYFGRHNRQSF